MLVSSSVESAYLDKEWSDPVLHSLSPGKAVAFFTGQIGIPLNIALITRTWANISLTTNPNVIDKVYSCRFNSDGYRRHDHIAEDSAH